MPSWVGNKEKNVKWTRHRTAKSLVEAFVELAHSKFSDLDKQYVSAAESNGMWAFVRLSKIPHIHYWYKPGADVLEVAFMLGHEIGHVSGKPLESYKNAWREEERADEYGIAVKEVLKRLRREGLITK